MLKRGSLARSHAIPAVLDGKAVGLKAAKPD